MIRSLSIEPGFVDVGDSTPFMDVGRVSGIESWDDLRGWIQDAAFTSKFGAIVIDDLTKAEELASKHVVRTIRDDKGDAVDGIEGYGFGKGYTYVYETFLLLLADLDALVRAGKWVICVAHECTSEVPNPRGADYLRYEPRLQSPASGKTSVRHRFKEWCDHLVCIGYDLDVNKQGVAVGSGTRTIYPVEQPFCMAKSRSLTKPILFQKGSDELWQRLVKGEQ